MTWSNIERLSCLMESAQAGDTRLCETGWVVKGNPKGCRVPKLMESVVFQDFCIYHFLHCKMKTHQLVVAFFNEICSKKN